MPIRDHIFETLEYQLVLMLPSSHRVLAIHEAEGYQLPSARLLPKTRPAQQLQEAAWDQWKVDVVVLSFLEGGPPCHVVGEVLRYSSDCPLRAVDILHLQRRTLTEYQRHHVGMMLDGLSPDGGALSKIGWIDEAICWVESTTGKVISSRNKIEQFNAGGGFALLRFWMEDGSAYWLKATGTPNIHELAVTQLLAELAPKHLPTVVSSKPEWNAWITIDGGRALLQSAPSIAGYTRYQEQAVYAMAEVQKNTVGHRQELLSFGAADQSLTKLRGGVPVLFDSVIEFMSLQTSTKVTRLGKGRIQEIETIADDVCRRMEDLDIEDTVIHGDINRGNILFGNDECRFIDWSETYVGNPLITLEHLLLLSKMETTHRKESIFQRFKAAYVECLSEIYDPEKMKRGFAYMPLLAILSMMYGRGDWLNSSEKDDPQRQAYTRSLTRHLDRAARALESREVVCQ